MKIVDDFRQILLGLILTGHIGEFDAVGGFDIYLGVALAHVEHHGVGPPPIFCMSFLDIHCPRPIKITRGRIKVSSRFISGDIC